MWRLFLLVLLLSSHVYADCWQQVRPGSYSDALNCSFREWQKHTDRRHFQSFLNYLFHVYLTDNESPVMKRFFNGLRSNDPAFSQATVLRNAIIDQYINEHSASIETAGLWMMAPLDARMLFVLTQVDPQAVPNEMSNAMQLTIYQQMTSMFVLDLATRQQFGTLPRSEYSRLLEILKRLSGTPDPYLKGLNQYYQGIVMMNIGDHLNGIPMVMRSRQNLTKCLTQVEQKLSRKRILSSIADANLVLGQSEEAAANYISILKIDPQDWSALAGLSTVLYRVGECTEAAIWIDATGKTGKELYEITVHCGNRELPVQEFEPAGPAIAEKFNAETAERAENKSLFHSVFSAISALRNLSSNFTAVQ